MKNLYWRLHQKRS